MSLRKLGDESGSKGSCFYVMYDHPVVIKFPQPRIYSFQDYLTMIQRERAFSKNLQPLTSIVPSLSIILEKYPPEIFENSEETGSQLKNDAQWLEYLENHDSMKQYLMIDGSYVLFMDLSSDLLMSQTLLKLSDYKPLMLNETLGNPEFISRPYEFESRYGKIEPDYLEAILDIFRHYEENIKRLSSHFSDISVSRHTCLQLFLLNLLGEDPDPGKTISEKDFHIKAANYFSSLSHMNPQAVSSCAAAIRSHYSRVNFNHHKQKLICLIKNMTDLLTHMYRNHFVMRDLKPDNMLIVGDSSHFPQFLNSPDSFSIGLIDLETALLMNDSTSFRQPVLGGTPRYALFHQFMLNSVLKNVYNPLDRVFYLQDWYAAAAVIFEITTGRKLYSKTVPFLNRYVKHLKHDFSKGNPETDIIKNGSHQFWTIAMGEFYIQMNLNKSKLETMHIPVSKDFLTILETELSSVLQQDKKAHSLFLNRCKPLYPEIEKLTHFKSQDLVAYIEKHRDKNRGTPRLKDLDQLGYYTFRFEQNRVYSKLLSRQQLNTYELLSILFYLVFTGLHKAEWGNPKTEHSDPGSYETNLP